MRILKPVFLIVFLFCVGNAGFLFAQTDQVPNIENPDTDPIVYCSDSVYVAPNISVENIQIDQADKGMKVSIVNYEQGEDRLGYDEVSTLNYKWDNSKGTLEISGVGTDEQYREAISKVYYLNLTSTRKAGVREFSINLLDADYLPYTRHFYQYIAQRGIRWTEAKKEAEKLKYYGLQGYLATITSSVENDFIWSKIDGVGWIGASDADKEGEWYWKTGPEAGTQFWRGNYNGSPVGGMYSNWNNGEPNNVHKSWGDYENYAHMVVAPDSKPKSWNDLSDEGDKNEPNGYYYPQGYLVEFGGMENLDLKLSTTAYIEVRENKRPELDLQRMNTLFCGSKSETVDLIFKEEDPLVELISLDSRATVENGLTLNPTISVDEFGKYFFLLNTIDEAGCSYSDTVMFEFHNQPEALFNLDEDECYGYNLQLVFTGNTVEETEFTWYYNQNEFQSGTGLDSVLIPLGFDDAERSVGLRVNEQGCTDSMTTPVKVKPDILVIDTNSVGCSPLEVSFQASANKPAHSYYWDFNDGSDSDDQNATHIFSNPSDTLKPFNISLTVLSDDGCENTAVFEKMVNVYPVPTAQFTPDPQEVLITDPEISFMNTSHAATAYLWDFGDSTLISEEKDPVHRYSAMRIYTVLLEVSNDYGCSDSIVKEVTVTFDQLFPPNAFSPNAPLEEDREFRIYGDGVLDEGYRLLIYDRWGGVVFESDSQQTGWNGKMKNSNFAPTGVYIWVLQYTDFTGEKHTQQGSVTLLY